MKTAPAFEVALYAGLRAADFPLDLPVLQQLATYLGEGYQLLNDLEDWQSDDENKRTAGLDALSARPTLLWAWAVEAGAGGRLANLLTGAEAENDSATVISGVRQIYRELGIFAKADRLLEALNQRAVTLAKEVSNPALQELLTLLIRILLRKTHIQQHVH